MADKKSAVEIVQARITVQEKKRLDLKEQAVESYIKHTELSELVEELEQAKVNKIELDKVKAQIDKHAQDNLEQNSELKRLEIKLDENREMLAILQGE